MSTTQGHAWFHALAVALALLVSVLLAEPLARAVLLSWGVAQVLLSWTASQRWRWHGAVEWWLATALLLGPVWLDATEDHAQRVSLSLGVLQAAAWLLCHDLPWSAPRRPQSPIRGPAGWWSRDDDIAQ